MIFEVVFLLIALEGPHREVRVIIVLSMIGALLIFFAIGFYWVFQIAVIDESGITIQLFTKKLRHVSWNQITAIERSNRFRNPEIKIIAEEERPLIGSWEDGFIYEGV